MDSSFNQWLDEALSFYQELGFFQHDQFAKLSKAEFLKKIDAEFFRERFTRSHKPPDQKQVWEQELLAKDITRVCWEDPEFVFENTGFYAMLLNHLANISRGKFSPTNITEEWLKFEGMANPIILLSFQLDHRPYYFWISRRSDYARPQFLIQVNRIIAKDGIQFWVYGADDWFITCQTDDEVLMMLERGHKLNKSFANTGFDEGVLTYPNSSDESYAVNWLDQVVTHLHGKPWDWDALFWPIYINPKDNQPADAWLIFQRGVHRYHQKDLSGSWHDFVLAAQYGYPNIEQNLINLGINYTGVP